MVLRSPRESTNTLTWHRQFCASGYPHLEEAYRVGELLFPHLDVAIPEIPQPQPLNPQGEAVANDFIPRNVAQS